MLTQTINEQSGLPYFTVNLDIKQIAICSIFCEDYLTNILWKDRTTNPKAQSNKQIREFIAIIRQLRNCLY